MNSAFDVIFGYHFCLRMVVTPDLDLAYPHASIGASPDLGGP
jgi:hypothetical protein